jgi:hypothetical protein
MVGPFVSSISLAENICVRIESDHIMLTDYPDCKAGQARLSRDARWKYATRENSSGEIDVGCWRADDSLIFVEIDTKEMMVPVFGFVDAKLCAPTKTVSNGRRWDAAIENCENLDLPDTIALESCQTAMTLAESLDESDPNLVRTLVALSVRDKNTGRREILLRRSLDIYRTHFSADYVGQIATMAALGSTRSKQPDWEVGIPIYKEAIALGIKTLGSDHLEVIAITLLLGKIYLDHGKLSEAEEMLLQAFAGAELNESSPWFTANSLAATSARLLAVVYRAKGNMLEAERYVEIHRIKKLPKGQEGLPKDIFKGDSEPS